MTKTQNIENNQNSGLKIQTRAHFHETSSRPLTSTWSWLRYCRYLFYLHQFSWIIRKWTTTYWTIFNLIYEILLRVSRRDTIQEVETSLQLSLAPNRWIPWKLVSLYTFAIVIWLKRFIHRKNQCNLKYLTVII